MPQATRGEFAMSLPVVQAWLWRLAASPLAMVFGVALAQVLAHARRVALARKQPFQQGRAGVQPPAPSAAAACFGRKVLEGGARRIGGLLAGVCH